MCIPNNSNCCANVICSNTLSLSIVIYFCKLTKIPWLSCSCSKKPGKKTQGGLKGSVFCTAYTNERITSASSSYNRVRMFDVHAIVHCCEPKTQERAKAWKIETALIVNLAAQTEQICIAKQSSLTALLCPSRN